MLNLSNFNLNKKILITVVGVIVLAEATWAYWTLGLPLPENLGKKNLPVTEVKKGGSAPLASASLRSSKTTARVSEKIKVDINLASSRQTDGSDIIVLYNPNLLALVPVDVLRAPVKVGNIYDDYPVNSVDEQAGRITVSGITAKAGGVVPQGLFGSITFEAKAPGIAQIAFDYTKGKTIDTNVIETKTAQDVLDEVHNLELNITP